MNEEQNNQEQELDELREMFESTFKGFDMV